MKIESIGGELSYTSKMPCASYSIPAQRCITGSKLVNVAGSTCEKCYALKGNYRYSNVRNALENRYQSLDHAAWCDGMVEAIESAPDGWSRDGIRTEHDREYFRWHDSGDLQSVAHLEKIVDVARKLPGVKFWLPTREYQIVREYLATKGEFPSNLTVRLSAHLIDNPPTKLGAELGLPTSTVTTKHEGENLCPAQKHAEQYLAETGKKRPPFCGDCRKCWDPTVKHVAYPKH